MQYTSSKPLPALSDNSRLRYFSFAILYLAQGIPEGMTYFGIPAWLASQGKSAAEIGGYVAVIGIPWTFKMLVAPLMDRYSYLPMGRRRPWIIFGQLGLLFAFLVLAMVPDPLQHLPLLTAAGFGVSLFSIFQDVAVDGMAIDIVPAAEQARVNSYMWGARIVGVSLSMALGSRLINQYGFVTAIITLALIISGIMFIPLLFRERPGEKLLPWMAGKASAAALGMQLESWPRIFKSLGKVMFMPYSLLIVVIGFMIGIAVSYMNTLLPVLTVQAMGWTNETYANTNAVASIIGGILGVLVGGRLLDKFGKVRMLSGYLIAAIAMAFVMYLSAGLWQHFWFSVGYVVLYNVLYVFMMVGFLAIAMQLCWKKISATQFTLYMGISNFGWIVGSALIGPAKAWGGWPFSILAFCLMAAAALVLLQLMRTPQHMLRLKNIEADDLASET